MIRVSFNDGWQFRPKVNPFAELGGHSVPYQPVTVPHDAMLGQERVAAGGGVGSENGAGAYFPGGTFEYRKTFSVPEEYRGRRIVLEFEGVYRDATVNINGDYAGQRPFGYAQFLIDADRFLRFGEDNEIRVEARSHRDSRWYTGAGIYRDTWLLVGGPVRISPDGVRVTTPDIERELAVAEVATRVENDSIAIRTVDVRTEIRDGAGTVVASDVSRITVLPGEPALCRQRLYIDDPALWGPDSPNLYAVGVTLRDGDGEVDTETVSFGIRSLRLDPRRGLRINGESVKLRGACVHHDNGVLGAATFARAEERRVEILKAAGFNAIRMSHNPMSRAMLDACDRLGVLVVDEAFDVWTSGKSEFDYSLSFPEWWERDIESMVAKDFNHPSVVLYSIGNEIPETGSAVGAAQGRALAEKVRALDGTRYVTNAVNGMLAVLADLATLREQTAATADEGAGINTLMADPGEMMNAVSSSELVSRRTAESFALLDVAGMNYAESRYALDKDLFPNRIILGTETFPTRIDGNWRLVERYGHVIGDFTWTGWDYLGEVGIGRPQYLTPDSPRPSFVAPYPYLLAGCGDIDITGHRRPASYYREIVFGLRAEPYLAVRRPQYYGQTAASTPWAWSDTVSSWTWPGFENEPIAVEVYSDADEVELFLNGRSLGRRPVGADHRFRTEFDTVHEPGELLAIAYRDGAESGRAALRSATGQALLRAEADRPVIGAADGDLAYVTLTLTDTAGTLHTGADRPVSVEVTGDGVLAGFGSADPSTEERFDAKERHTYQGRALAVIRPTGTGEIRLTAAAPGCEPAEVTVTVAAATADVTADVTVK
ncbi:glycoside hydrolase family 2 TIM barrel-domain containing protein [Streptomyces sp. JV176]|uniref:glycoside hydrolase family 2 TIM barrel-domain containing protein n=1 Tax=Streptomyces sp. JV176 TaxID=858630 RepID=UPI002E75FC30|nr:glycoside hydrolase family 2 TIM barrel-domain containing protein [Streptomyces sp. JV176]MEE1800687.1 glycoside hydrolase family 2 TIM barrel-domain containing protein [Streptomyces sp. JV176]